MINVINLTFEYTNPIKYTEHNFGQFSVRRKKTLIKTGLIILLSLVILYLYLAASLVAKNADRARLGVVLNEESSKLNQTENETLKEGAIKDINFFISHGFEKPKNIDFIKRTGNVAESKEILSAYY